MRFFSKIIDIYNLCAYIIRKNNIVIIIPCFYLQSFSRPLKYNPL